MLPESRSVDYVRFPPIAAICHLPNTAAMFKLSLPLLALLLSSCSDRPGTAAYFTNVSGVPLCSGASVSNVNADAPDRSPGFDTIYIVEVSMPATCKGPFAKAVAQRIGAQCEPMEGCSGNAKNGDFYGVEPTSIGFRVTHST